MIEQRKVEELIEYGFNNKDHPEKQIDLLANSIKEFGFNSPIILDKDNFIIAGHGRLLAAKKLGMDEVPTIMKDDLSEEQVRRYRLLDNKIAELATDNLENISKELEVLADPELDELYGKKLAPIENDKEDEDVIPPEHRDIIIEKGDIIQLGQHRIICGDSLDATTYERVLEGIRPDLGHNDPPYGMGLESKGVENDNLNTSDLLQFNKDWIYLQTQFLKENGSMYIWGIDEPLMDIHVEIMKPLIAEQKATFRNLLTWDKNSGQGQNSENTRSFATADEKCLFYMM